jgi:predicted lipoprotein with Yx(FWY)xxD motif
MHTKSLGLAAVCAAIAAAAFAATGSAARVPVVKTLSNASLGKTILVDRRGKTLYQLSVEKHGKFICTNTSCLSFWKPLVLAKGSTPGGTTALGLVKRPDGRLQVTYRGMPLYTFAQDAKSGDVRGEGFKDVGTWHAAAVGGSAATTASPAPATTTTSRSGGYGGYGP